MMNIENLKKALGDPKDLTERTMAVKKRTITVLFLEVLVDGEYVNDFILKRISYLDEKPTKEVLLSCLPSNNIQEVKEENEALDYICKGFALIITKSCTLAVESKASIDRGIGTSEMESVIIGPRDAFNENFNTNLGLIRRRIRSSNLHSKTYFVGEKSRAKLAVLYMQSIAMPKNVEMVLEKIEGIHTDGILDAAYLKRYLKEKNTFFPTIMATERPDKSAMALLEGKIVIILDNSPYALILPSFFIDFFHTPDDYYQKDTTISFIRIIRLCAFFISIFIPAFYIAVTTHNQDAIPLSLLSSFTAQRQNVPFSALIEALFMSLSFEILRESDLRKPTVTGTAVSILGGLILGDAAVSAGLISPIMIIVISISAISGLAFSSVELTSSIRFFRFLLLFLSFAFGLFGIYIGLLILIATLNTTSTLSLPYLAPFSPYIKSEMKDAIFKIKEKKKRTRNPLLTKNKERGN